MFSLSVEDDALLDKLVGEVSKDGMAKNWEDLMSLMPAPSGGPEVEDVMQFIQEELNQHGVENQLLRFDGYVSLARYARLKIIEPFLKDITCIPHQQVGSTDPGGIEGDCIYISPEEIGFAACQDKIVLTEQAMPDGSMLRYKRMLRLQEMGVKGLIVISEDDFMPNIIHYKGDFSVSGNPTPENFSEIQQIPAIVCVSNNAGMELRSLAKSGGMRVRLTSVVDTGWKNLPILVGETKGMREPDRFLLLYGHVDTHPFSPGVTDNASGIVAMLEMARILNKYQDRLGRSVRYAFWTGHEIGRYSGSTWYNDAFWHDMRYRCVCTQEMDSPGPEGATLYPYVPIGETYDLIKESQRFVIDGVGADRWMGRASDRSFFGTGVPHGYIYPARPQESFDPAVNYSGGGWWWHTPWSTIDRGDPDILVRDVKSNLYFSFRVINCKVLPFSYVSYAHSMVEMLSDLQQRADKIRGYFDLVPVIERAKEFSQLAEQLERAMERVDEIDASDGVIKTINNCLMEISRNITPISRWNAEKTGQISMEDIGYSPFPRLRGILRMTDIELPESEEFKLWYTKLLRERNYVEDGFHLANEAIRDAMGEIREELE